MTYSFLYDYAEGCHPEILRALTDTNLQQQIGYGDDDYCEEARAFIQKHLKRDADIHFVAGGTQANLIMIANALRSHEAVISVAGGHIELHETGAIEAVGHKVIAMPGDDGKLTPDDVRRAVRDNSMAPHMAKPRLVYISNATETGRVYSKSELSALSILCKELGLLLMLDGARLSAALMSDANDLSLPDIAELTDMFWIGGTKAGALIGEAIVICNDGLKTDFRFHIKQRGALLAKGRILGLQFRELFRDDLYFRSGTYANDLAQKLSDAILAAGHKLASPTETNQIFPILPNDLIDRLEQDFVFYRWEERGVGHTMLRLVTSWTTDPDQIERLITTLCA